jgi:hypothetical protein
MSVEAIRLRLFLYRSQRSVSSSSSSFNLVISLLKITLSSSSWIRLQSVFMRSRASGVTATPIRHNRNNCNNMI